MGSFFPFLAGLVNGDQGPAAENVAPLDGSVVAMG